MKNLALRERKSQKQREKENSKYNTNFAHRKSMKNSRSEFYRFFGERKSQKQREKGNSKYKNVGAYCMCP